MLIVVRFSILWLWLRLAVAVVGQSAVRRAERYGGDGSGGGVVGGDGSGLCGDDGGAATS
jgi:hypothetical protein